MALPNRQQVVYQLSVLDRLLDPEPNRQANFNKLLNGIKRDLQSLLNTRSSYLQPYLKEGKLSRSLLTYGLADYTHLNPQSQTDIQLFKNNLVELIAHHEPRLGNVNIEFIEPQNEGNVALKFRITAQFKLKPDPIWIQLSTLYHAEVGQFSVN